MKALFKRVSPFAFFLFAAIALFVLFAPPAATAGAEPAAKVAKVTDGAGSETEYESFSEALQNWDDGETLTLLADCEAESTVEVSNAKFSAGGTLDLGGRVLSLKENGGEYVLSVGGKLTLRNGEIAGGKTASVSVSGQLVLSGNVVVKRNQTNVALSNENRLGLDEFAGEVGVTPFRKEGVFAGGTLAGGKLFSDDPDYSVRADGNEFSLAPAALKTLSVSFEQPEEKIFPTTPLSDLRPYLTVAGTNENGAPYHPNPSDPSEQIEYEIVGTLAVPECTLEVRAGGVSASFSAVVAKPALLSLSAEYAQSGERYFNDPLSEIAKDLAVTGTFEDGKDRKLLFEGSDERYEENYIDARYALSWDPSKRTKGDKTPVTASVGNLTAEFEVALSKYEYRVQDFTVLSKTVIVGETDELTAADFLPDLPAGVEASLVYKDKPFSPEGLAPGIYPLTIAFKATDELNCKPISETRETSLAVNRKTYEISDEKGELVYYFMREGGISPAWEFTVKDVTADYGELEGDLKALKALEFTLFRAESEPTGEIAVRVYLDESLREEEFALYRVNAEGKLEKVRTAREGDYLVFAGSDFLETDYVFAVEGGFTVYLVCTIVFGAVCVLGAAALLCYIVFKRKLPLR